MKKLLLVVGIFALCFSLSSCSLPPGTENMIPGRGDSQYSGEMCIDPGQIGTSAILTNIPKPNESNVPFAGSPSPWVDCGGQGECATPDTADYVMVQENVKMETVWPDDRTTRLSKQILPNNPAYDSIKNLVYRATCNDWCGLSLPVGGTLFCDFIFLLHSDEPLADREIAPGVIEPYPQDGAMFDILIRQGAGIPNYIGQPGKERPLRCDLITPTPGTTSYNWLFEGLLPKALAQNETFININDPADSSKKARFIYHNQFGLHKAKIREESQGRKKWGEIVFRNIRYDVYLNLPTIEPISNDYVYLVENGVLDQVLAQTDPFYSFDYFEFRRTKESRPLGKSLQLGTFPIPVSDGWWTLFANESKPAIYLYPPKPTALRVKLNPAGQLTITDPPYNSQTGWEILAYPDGTIKHLGGGRMASCEVGESTYPYLFYEAELEKVWVEPEGFMVEGKNLVRFFERTLPELGLNNQETKDFIDYWMSRLNKSQPYYFVHFLDSEQIEQLEPLEITEHETWDTKQDIQDTGYKIQDTEIRIRAYFKPLEKPTKIKPQELPIPPERKNFVLVEWGGILDD